MDFIHLVILAIVQGVTEFLPVSSSAHLILLPQFLDWEDQGMAIDVAAHLGSLIAVLIYCRADVKSLIFTCVAILRRKETDPAQERLFFSLIFASIPVLLAGFLFHDFVGTYLREPWVIAFASIGFGLLLWYADRRHTMCREITSLSWRAVFIIGCAQMMALIPGASRAGMVMTAGLFLGLTRTAATRFSFLLAIPVTSAAAAYEGLLLFKHGTYIDMLNFTVVILLSAISAILTLHVFVALIQRVGFLPFVIYRILLGGMLLFIFSL